MVLPLHAEILAPDVLSTLTLLDATQAGSRIVLVGEHGTVLLSDDASTWRKSPTPTDTTLTRVFFIDDKNGWACGHDQTILHTTDGGESWTLQKEDTSTTLPFLDVLFLNPQEGFVVGAYGSFWETRSGGKTWEKRSLPGVGDRHINVIRQLSTGELLVAGESGLFLISKNNGKTWDNQSPPAHPSIFDAVEIRPGEILLCGLAGHRWRVSLSSHAWKKYSRDIPDPLYSLASDGSQIFYLGGGRHVYRSSDGGHSAQAIAEIPFELSKLLVLKGSRIAVLGTGGIKILNLAETKH